MFPVARPARVPLALAPLVVAALALTGLLAPGAGAQSDPQLHDHHHHAAPAAPAATMGHQHGASLGPAGTSYDLRWLDAMVQHHTGALRMGEFVFDIGQGGVGALAKAIWADQAQEIKAMGQWRKAWYPEAPPYPVAWKSGGDPNALADLVRMTPEQIEAMRMVGAAPSRESRVRWFLEGMIAHHGGALEMAHDALQKSTNTTIRRQARQIIVAQRREILALRRMLRHDGLVKPAYFQYDALFSF